MDCGRKHVQDKREEAEGPVKRMEKYGPYLMSPGQALHCPHHRNEKWVYDIIRICFLERSLRLQYREIYLWVEGTD